MAIAADVRRRARLCSTAAHNVTGNVGFVDEQVEAGRAAGNERRCDAFVRATHPGPTARLRFDAEAIRLETQLLSLLIADPRVQGMEPDPVIEQLARHLGLGNAGLGIIAAEVDGLRLTLISVPYRSWRNGALKHGLLQLRRVAKLAGRRVVLVPRSVIRREPRLSNAKLIAGCVGQPVGGNDILAIRTKLEEEPGATLSECAEVVTGPDRVGRILAMIAMGFVTSDLRRPITPYSELYLPSRTVSDDLIDRVA